MDKIQRSRMMRKSLPIEKSSFAEAKDLQLAAELGRNLLERNEELENELKLQQSTIEDQGHEIMFLTKQITSMKEESLSRSKVYEQLESSLSDLERNNADLSRKHELDKKRMQSLCENISYLESKCEELSGTLDSIRDSNKKHYNSKINQSGYFTFGGSDSSEDDSGCGYGFRRRSQSLQDLRDYSPSPNDLDSNHSNSPDLKNSEAEFIGTLEARVEELIGVKKKESEKITQLENQVRLLIQENTNLQQKLTQVTSDKDDQIDDLRFQLLDQTTTSLSHRTPFHYNQPSVFPTPSMSPESTVSQASSFRDFNNLTSPNSMRLITERTPKPICKRCSTEIAVLNLVNSIEIENDEYSSLEFEMARADEAQHFDVFGKQNGYHSIKNPYFDRYPEFTRSQQRFESDRNPMRDLMNNYPDEDTCLVKDFGPEIFTKGCDDSDKAPLNKKLKLPAKIPAVDNYSNDDGELSIKNVIEPNGNSPGAKMDLDNLFPLKDPVINTKKRSKLWWFAYICLLVLGILEFIGAIFSFTFFLIIAAILPKRSHSTSMTASPPRYKLLRLQSPCRKAN